MGLAQPQTEHSDVDHVDRAARTTQTAKQPSGANKDLATLPATPRARQNERPRADSGVEIPAPESARGGRVSRVDEIFSRSTAIRAMHVEEAARARGFSRVIMILALAGILVDPFLTVTPLWLRITTCATLALMGGVAAWVYLRARDPSRYSRRVFRVFACTAVASAIVVLYHAGVFSPIALVLTLGISFFGLGRDRSFAHGASIFAALAYLVLAALVVFDVIPDLGLYRAESTPLGAHLFMLALVPSSFLLTLWQARLSRRATIDAIQRSNEAIRLARQREAQLDEANQNLDQVLRAGAGHKGRYSGTRAGKYLLAEVVGRGAMGEVYAASHVETDQRAAVKLVQSSVLGNPSLMKRFLREGEMAKRLAVPNVVRVYEIGEAADGAPYIAMELLRGHDLSWHLRQRQKLELCEVVELIEQVAAGLCAAHREAIVHRDLKPQNLFLAETAEGQRPSWKILDFGISKLQDASGTLTKDVVIGTPGYMSPEQAQGSDIDHRSDIFSLGAVAYRALTGQPPFTGSDLPQILFEIVYVTPSRPSDFCATLPADVDLMLALALAKRPEDRFASALEFASALRAASRGQLDAALRERALSLTARYPWGRSALDVRCGEELTERSTFG